MDLRDVNMQGLSIMSNGLTFKIVGKHRHKLIHLGVKLGRCPAISTRRNRIVHPEWLLLRLQIFMRNHLRSSDVSSRQPNSSKKLEIQATYGLVRNLACEVSSCCTIVYR